MDLSAVLGELYARAARGVRMDLGAMRAACALYGEPQDAFPVVHVAGTNGKGSVSAMIEAIARRTGKRTGLFTSPHLCRFAERIRLDGEPIGDDLLGAALADALVRAMDLSFFEVATLTALNVFREAKVELAVLEVGIGGRLDATNVVRAPVAAAVTRIAMDHTDKLGDTLESIAREKAGIAKPGLDLVLGRMPDSIAAVIGEVARAAGATTTRVEDRGDAHAAVVALRSRSRVGLAGAHQIANAEVAWLLGERIGASEADRAAGIVGVRWPGRLELIETEEGAILLDAAHNPDGARALATHLATHALPKRTALIFGALADKAWVEMLDALAPAASLRVYVPVHPGTPGRAGADPAEIASRYSGRVASDFDRAYALARREVGPEGLVVVCGSILLVGEARARMLDLPTDPPVAL